MVAAEQNFNPFNVDKPTFCSDATLPKNELLRGITPLVDPAVTGADVANALSAKSKVTPLDATGKSVADVVAANGFTNFLTKDAAGVAGAAPVAGAGAADAGAGAADAAAGNENAAAGNGTEAAAGAGAVDAGAGAANGTAGAVDAGAVAANGTAAADAAKAAACAKKAKGAKGNNKKKAGGKKGGKKGKHGKGGKGKGGKGKAKNAKTAKNNGDAAAKAAKCAAQAAASKAAADAAAATTLQTVVATATAAAVANNTADAAAGAGAADAAAGAGAADAAAGAGNVAAGGADFGLCDPTIKFQGGLGGRPATEFTFQSNDAKISAIQQEALNPNIITNRVCDELTNQCQANDAAKALCLDAKAKVLALGTRNQATADTFNAALGVAAARR